MGNNESNMKAKESKMRLAEVHPQFERSLALVYHVSLEKGYTPNNWLDTTKVPPLTLISAARRHINQHLSGELFNIEEGCTVKPMHLECAAYGLLMVATQLRNMLHASQGKIKPQETLSAEAMGKDGLEGDTSSAGS